MPAVGPGRIEQPIKRIGSIHIRHDLWRHCDSSESIWWLPHQCWRCAGPYSPRVGCSSRRGEWKTSLSKERGFNGRGASRSLCIAFVAAPQLLQRSCLHEFVACDARLALFLILCLPVSLGSTLYRCIHGKKTILGRFQHPTAHDEWSKQAGEPLSVNEACFAILSGIEQEVMLACKYPSVSGCTKPTKLLVWSRCQNSGCERHS